MIHTWVIRAKLLSQSAIIATFIIHFALITHCARSGCLIKREPRAQGIHFALRQTIIVIIRFSEIHIADAGSRISADQLGRTSRVSSLANSGSLIVNHVALGEQIAIFIVAEAECFASNFVDATVQTVRIVCLNLISYHWNFID